MAGRQTEETGSAGANAFERLYGVEPDEFVAERKRLERELREQGRTDDAAAVAARRKPTLPVFAANRLARARPDDVEALIAAASRIASAHESGEPEQVREAQAELTRRVRVLVGAAGQATGQPLSGDAEQRLATLLRAAAVDPGTAPLLRRGVIAEELQPSGFDALSGLSLAAPAGGAKRAEPSGTRTSSQAAKRREKVEQLEGELADAREALRRAEKALGAARQEAERAAKRVADLERRLARAEAAV